VTGFLCDKPVTMTILVLLSLLEYYVDILAERVQSS
jgi:hypothetical protein